MDIHYYELSYDDISQISQMEQRYFSSSWSEASIGHYAEAGNTIFIVARSEEPYIRNVVTKEDVATNTKDDVNIADNSMPKRVVGYAAVLCAADEGNLVSIAVEDEYREMGIATELLDIAYEMAIERGVTSINLEVRESNHPAISLYEREGFEKTGRRPHFYRNPDEDALLYIKQL